MSKVTVGSGSYKMVMEMVASDCYGAFMVSKNGATTSDLKLKPPRPQLDSRVAGLITRTRPKIVFC